MPNPVSFRLSDEHMSVIQRHAASLEVLYRRKVDRTEALEHIIEMFDSSHNRTFFAKLKKALTMPNTKGLDSFLQNPAEINQEIKSEQLQEALH